MRKNNFPQNIREVFEFWIHLFFIRFHFLVLFSKSHLQGLLGVVRDHLERTLWSRDKQWRHLAHLTLHLDCLGCIVQLQRPRKSDIGTLNGTGNSQDIRGMRKVVACFTEALWASPQPKQLHCRRWKTWHARCYGVSFGTKSQNSKFECVLLHPWYLATFVKDRLKVPRNLKAQKASKSPHRLNPVLQCFSEKVLTWRTVATLHGIWVHSVGPQNAH